MMGFGLIGFLILIAALFYILEQRPQKGQLPWSGTGQRSPGDSAHGALDVIKERYARGEITRDEYLLMKDDLQ